MRISKFSRFALVVVIVFFDPKMKNRAGLDFAVVVQLSYKYRIRIVFSDAFSLQNITFGSMEPLFCLFLKAHRVPNQYQQCPSREVMNSSTCAPVRI